MKPVLAALFISFASAQAADLLIAAASDLAPLVPALERQFEHSTGHHARFSLASSGSLARQIENGAPFDVFLSANEQYVAELAGHHQVDPASVTRYALGRLALWSASHRLRKLPDLLDSGIQHIAMPNPAHAPYGIAARQALEQQGLWKRIETKIVYGENVRQALQFAESRNSDAVITSWTLLKGRGSLLAAEGHEPIAQTAAIISASKQPAAAKAFIAFLLGPEGSKILQDGGLFPPMAGSGDSKLPARQPVSTRPSRRR